MPFANDMTPMNWLHFCGDPIENGDAVETSAGSGKWIYTATASVESMVNVQVVATDRPGGTAVMNVNKTF